MLACIGLTVLVRESVQKISVNPQQSNLSSDSKDYMSFQVDQPHRTWPNKFYNWRTNLHSIKLICHHLSKTTIPEKIIKLIANNLHASSMLILQWTPDDTCITLLQYFSGQIMVFFLVLFFIFMTKLFKNQSEIRFYKIFKYCIIVLFTQISTIFCRQQSIQ